MDTRPKNCRQRLQDEGKAYPRSGCEACRRSVFQGLGEHCTLGARIMDRLRENLSSKKS